ncbi:putative bifunctional diguanylate cyclase/phosphodiesterase [Roseicella frigidaeris]|nr:EAL domain-containing protein [Roseicella frigidaeris]
MLSRDRAAPPASEGSGASVPPAGPKAGPVSPGPEAGPVPPDTEADPVSPLPAPSLAAPGSALPSALLAAIEATGQPCPGEACDLLRWRERALIEALGIAVSTVDATGRLAFYNAAAAELWGWSPPLLERHWCGAWRLFAPDGTPVPPEQSATALCLRGQRPPPGSWVYAERPDGRRIPFAAFPSPLRNLAGQVVGAVTVMVELTGLHAAEAARATVERQFRAAQDALPDGFMLVHPDGEAGAACPGFTIDYLNPAAARLFDASREAVQGGPLRRLLAGHPRCEALLQALAEVLARGEPLRSEECHRRGRDMVWLRLHATRLGDGLAITLEDITERREAEARIRFLALHDPLTGMPNRAALQDRLLQAGRAGTPVAVLALDLDGFRGVNDALGHMVGDLLLREAAARILGCLEPGDLAARLDGDEFALLLPGEDAQTRAMVMASRVRRALTAPFALGEYRASIGVTIGIAIGQGPAPQAEALLRHADLALFRARAEERGSIRCFTPPMATQRENRLLLLADLREALSGSGVAVAYQPIIDLRRNRASGFEALLRWNHPYRGPIPPAEFVPVAEESGLILQLGEWVLRRACADAATWPAGMKVAVNLSPVQMIGGEVPRLVREALAEAGLPAERLELEITESVLLQHNETVLATLRELRTMGVRLALDDFGTGYASLAYLRVFRFDKIKIDQSFVRDAVRRPDCLAIVRSVAGLAAELGMTATAEGVEEAEHLAMVRGAGCPEAQGYHLGRPVALAELGRFLWG